MFQQNEKDCCWNCLIYKNRKYKEIQETQKIQLYNTKSMTTKVVYWKFKKSSKGFIRMTWMKLKQSFHVNLISGKTEECSHGRLTVKCFIQVTIIGVSTVVIFWEFCMFIWIKYHVLSTTFYFKCILFFNCKAFSNSNLQNKNIGIICHSTTFFEKNQQVLILKITIIKSRKKESNKGFCLIHRGATINNLLIVLIKHISKTV